jgi:ATP-dependent Lon protease
MLSAHNQTSQGTLVIPLVEIVVFPESRTKFRIDKATAEILLTSMRVAGIATAVGLAVKSATPPSEVTAGDLYTTGTLLQVTRVQPADDGYLVCAQGLQRVKAVFMHEKDGQLYAELQPVPDTRARNSSPSPSNGWNPSTRSWGS